VAHHYKPIKRGEIMKKMASWAILSFMVLTLAACAGTMGNENVRVKCPSCGYEFDIDTP
jgi:hypothetical protein